MTGVTDWFGSDTPPVHVGWYDVLNVAPHSPFFEENNFADTFYWRAWWSGKVWRFGPSQPKYRFQHKWWRGRDSEV